MKIAKLLLGTLGCLIGLQSYAQSISEADSILLNWYNKDLSQDEIMGASVDRAYEELLKDKKPKKTIVVAVLDNGIDTNQIDLKGRYWINEGEIPGNGVDDDGNGYPDDIYGWNFLGNASGEHLVQGTLEMTRVVRRFQHQFEKKDLDTNLLSPIEKQEYTYYQKARELYEEEYESRKETNENLNRFDEFKTEAWNTIYNQTGIAVSKKEDLLSLRDSRDPKVLRAASFFYNLYENDFSQEDFDKALERNRLFLDKYLNLQYDPRSEIIGDNPLVINDSLYGNPDVQGELADHGTPIAGIIAGIRNNNIGVDGIAEHVRIMILKTTPGGDELDKDVAMAIRYAADNGANIINMSFGKQLSPEKELVDAAVRYAAEKGVLFICSAGNSAKDIDVEDTFPSNYYLDGSKIPAWITVGSNRMEMDKYVPSVFSNYGQSNVHLFAPGEDIVALDTADHYHTVSGTSFSGPVVTGVAALIWSYYPDLTASELEALLLESVYVVEKPKKVRAPYLGEGKRPKERFKSLSTTGGIVNAYQALQLLEERSK